MFRFRRGREEAIVEAEDLGYAVRVIVRGERQTRELARFHDADDPIGTLTAPPRRRRRTK